MFIFERLISKDLEKVYYLIHNEKKNMFNFYTQDEETIMRIITSENWEATFFDVYTELYKTVREKLKDELLDWKIPLYSKCINLDCKKIAAERKKREREGKKTRLLLKS